MAISLNQTGSRIAKTPEALPKSVSGQGGGFFKGFGRTIKTTEVLFFSSQLSLMLDIGTPLNVALNTIKEQTENPAFKDVIQDMIQAVVEGRQLSDAMKEHPKVFDGLFVSMVTAGETGGFLKKILDRIVELQEKSQVLKTQLRTALTYPAVLCVVATLVIIFILVYVLPKFAVVFEGKESILPFTTRFLLAMSASLKEYWWIYIISSIGTALCLKFFKESTPGQVLIDRFSVSGPLVSKLCNKIYTCQLLRTLGNLMESQVPLLEALGVTRRTINNRYFRQFIDKIVEHVHGGGKFSQPFATYPYTLESVKQMVATGEEAGNLPKVMLRLAEFYDVEVDRELKIFASMMEPIALIVMGGVVGLIVSSVILPLFRMASTVN